MYVRTWHGRVCFRLLRVRRLIDDKAVRQIGIGFAFSFLFISDIGSPRIFDGTTASREGIGWRCRKDDRSRTVVTSVSAARRRWRFVTVSAIESAKSRAAWIRIRDEYHGSVLSVVGSHATSPSVAPVIHPSVPRIHLLYSRAKSAGCTSKREGRGKRTRGTNVLPRLGCRRAGSTAGRDPQRRHIRFARKSTRSETREQGRPGPSARNRSPARAAKNGLRTPRSSWDIVSILYYAIRSLTTAVVTDVIPTVVVISFARFFPRCAIFSSRFRRISRRR